MPEEPPEEFNFPFKPYPIQIDLMTTARTSFEEGKFAIIESPTGTGKSLSLICSSLTWLRDHQLKLRERLEKDKQELTAKIEKLKEEEDNSCDWLSAQTKRKDVSRNLEETNHQLEKLLRFERRSEARQHAKLFNIPLENYAAFQDKVLETDKKTTLADIDLTHFLRGSPTRDQENENDVDLDLEKKTVVQDDDQVKPKIFYASRTHSQLTQFVNEIKRTTFAKSTDGPPVKVVSLASRANMCVNPEVTKLKDPNAINERCTEMSRETSKDKRCPFVKPKQLQALKESILTSVQDIEDITRQGRYVGACPYYASRFAVTEAEVVVLPYNNLLHQETRKASNLDLKDNVIIVDEAHNILETICSIHSSSITGQNLIGAHTILSRYYKKFHSRMSVKNAEMIKNIVYCLTAIIRFLDSPAKHLSEYDNPQVVDLETKIDTSITELKPPSTRPTLKSDEIMIDVSKFIGAANVEKFNIFKILDYFNRSQLSRKLIGFFKQDSSFDLSLELADTSENNCSRDKPNRPANKKRKISSLHQNNIVKESPIKIKCISDSIIDSLTNLSFIAESNSNLALDKERSMGAYPIYILVEFLRSLTNLIQDGKVLVGYSKDDIMKSSLKFVLLNPASQFKLMIQEARSIVLAGGTMQPLNEFVDLLFGPLGVSKNRMVLFSCGHVIRPEQLYVTTLSIGPSGKSMELSYRTRSNFETIDEIGRCIMNIANIVPAGMVCFFPSYDYEQFCFNRWTQTGFISTIETKSKRVFREPRQSAHMKPIWDEYSRTIEQGKGKGRGALLLCVVGGKMSEGINFNDDLGRCVVMVGLPYANIKSMELQQKMAFYDSTCGGRPKDTLSAGQEYYENLCIKGLNQSIGRAVRHKDDYAAIILLDRRFKGKQSIRAGLPQWIRRSLVDQDQFGPLLSQLRTFYITNSSQQ